MVFLVLVISVVVVLAAITVPHLTSGPTYNPGTYRPPAPTDPFTPGPRPTPSHPIPGNQYTPGPPDYNPPPVPRYDEDEWGRILTDNPAYYYSMVDVDCPIQPAGRGLSAQEMEVHMNAVIECFMAAWYPVFIEAGFELPRPALTVTSGGATSPCGSVTPDAVYYCTSDQQIYVHMDFFAYWNSAFWMEFVIGHEFGHHLQARMGILAIEIEQEYLTSTDTESIRLSRVLELQADCLGGLGLRVIGDAMGLSDSDKEDVYGMLLAYGGEPYEEDHGTGTSQAYWFREGLNSYSADACNTWAAPESLLA